MIATVAGNMVAYMHAYSLLFVCVYAILLEFFLKSNPMRNVPEFQLERHVSHTANSNFTSEKNR